MCPSHVSDSVHSFAKSINDAIRIVVDSVPPVVHESVRIVVSAVDQEEVLDWNQCGLQSRIAVGSS